MAYTILQDENGDEYAIYHDYHIYRDGRVYSTKRGRFLKGKKLVDTKTKQVTLMIDGIETIYTLKRLIYHIFIDENIPPIGKNDYIFACKDGNENNVSVDNLQIYTTEEFGKTTYTTWVNDDDNNRYTINNAQTDYDIHTDSSGLNYVEYHGYHIYDNGAIIKLEPTPKTLNGFLSTTGMWRVELIIDGKKTRYTLKKLIAHCFIY